MLTVYCVSAIYLFARSLLLSPDVAAAGALVLFLSCYYATIPQGANIDSRGAARLVKTSTSYTFTSYGTNEIAYSTC